VSYFSRLHKCLDLTNKLGYILRDPNIGMWLHTLCGRCIINIENTLQASPIVRCRDAQTGGFIIFRGGYAL